MTEGVENSETIKSKIELELEEAQVFIKAIRELKESDKGRYASLKRGGGNTLGESRNVAWFHGILGRYAKGRNEETYYLIATLMPLNKHSLSGNFANSLKILKTKKTNEASIDKRFNILLDADFDREGGEAAGGELSFRLRQLVKLLASKEVGVDWAQLLIDLKRWGDVKKQVQKRWAKSFYTSSASDETPTVSESM